MTVMKMLLCRNEFRFRLKHYDVGIKTFSDAALAQIASSKACRTFGHPPCDVGKCEAARTGFRPHHRQSQREAGDSTPRRLEVSFAEPLHLRRTGGLIRRNQIVHYLSKALSKICTIFSAANLRRSAESALHRQKLTFIPLQRDNI